MLQSIRNKASSWFALAIIFLALFALTFFGVGDYLTTPTDTYVAKVGDEEISQNAYRQRFEEWRQNMRQQMGEGVDPQMLQQPAFKRQILDQMVNEAVLRQANDRLDLVVPASRLRSEILAAPVFQVAGRFDQQSYRSFLANRGMSAAAFDRELSNSFAAQILPEAVQSSALMTDAEVDAYLRLSEQTRDFRYLRIAEPAEPISDEISDADLQAYYDENAADFMSEETVTVEYVELDSTSIAAVEEASEQDLKDRYEAEKARFGSAEARLSSHILVRAEGEDADAQKAALEKAETIVAKTRAEGGDFAALATAESDDLGTREQGGDLGWIERGLTDPAFEEALFAMDAGTISEPVRSEEGYHIIQLREIREATQKPFEDVREELAAEYAASESERLYAERSGELIDLIYEEPGSLQPTAEALGLDIKTAGPFTRASGEELFANPTLRETAFSDPVLVEGSISDPVEVDEGRMVAMRMTDHVRSAPRPLADVADQIRTRVTAQRRTDALKAHADTLMARVAAGEELEAIATELGVEVETAEGTGRSAATPERALVDAVFRLQRPGDGARRELVDVGPAHAIVELTAVNDGDPATVEAARRDQVRNELQQSYANAEARGLLASLREQTQIVIAEDRIQ